MDSSLLNISIITFIAAFIESVFYDTAVNARTRSICLSKARRIVYKKAPGIMPEAVKSKNVN